MRFNLFSFAPRAFQQRHLDTDDGHQVFYARYGNPKGKLIVCFHGGPGGSRNIKKSSFEGFDLKKYQMLFINQRGCGISLPSGKIEGNDTEKLLDDVKKIIELTGVKDKVILKGGSWGSTLALLFAQKYPYLVEKMILSQVFLAREIDLDWLYNKTNAFYPDMLERVKSHCKNGEGLINYYHRLTFSDSILDIKKALENFGALEFIMGSLDPKFSEKEEISEREIASFRIYMHYVRNMFFIKDNQILNNMYIIRNIPTLIVHNRLDFVCTLEGAYDLAKEFDDVKFVVSPEKGHVGDLLYKTIAEESEKFLA